MSLGPANELTPQKTYRLMFKMAAAMLVLLSVAIYSLSRLSTAPWASQLKTPTITSTSRQDLPRFEVVSEGKRLTPETFLEKWTLLSFWSYGCPPCLEEMPALNALAQNWQGPENFNVLTVNLDEGENLESAKRFLQEQEIVLPTIYDVNKTLKNAFGVNEYPRHFLVDPQGKIVWSASGAFRWNEAAARDQLLKLMELQAPEPDADLGE